MIRLTPTEVILGERYKNEESMHFIDEKSIQKDGDRKGYKGIKERVIVKISHRTGVHRHHSDIS